MGQKVSFARPYQRFSEPFVLISSLSVGDRVLCCQRGDDEVYHVSLVGGISHQISENCFDKNKNAERRNGGVS
jgi:hypothetical protein